MDENEVEKTEEPAKGEIIKAENLYAMVPLKDYYGMMILIGAGSVALISGIYKTMRDDIIPAVKDGIERYRWKKRMKKLEAEKSFDSEPDAWPDDEQ